MVVVNVLAIVQLNQIPGKPVTSVTATQLHTMPKSAKKRKDKAADFSVLDFPENVQLYVKLNARKPD